MKNIRIIGFMIIGLLIFGGLTSAVSKKQSISNNGWERLGVKSVGLNADHDVIPVTHHKGHYTRLKFAIKKAPIYLRNINIVFGNGANKNIVFNKRFPAGSFTRIIDLPGNKRIIKKIKLNYKTVGKSNHRAIIAAWGKH